MFIEMVWKIRQIVEWRSAKVTYKSVRSRSVITRATILVDIAGLGLPWPGPFLSYGVCRIGLLLLIVGRFYSIIADVIVHKGLDQSFATSFAIRHLTQCLISHKVSMWSCLFFTCSWRSIILSFLRAITLIWNCWKLRCSRELSKLILHSSNACNILTWTLS